MVVDPPHTDCNRGQNTSGLQGYYSGETGAPIQEVETSRSSFHLCQVSVKFRLHKCPRRYDRGFTAQHSGHTSSISGDHRAALPGGGALMDGQKQELVLSSAWPFIGAAESMRAGQIYGTPLSLTCDPGWEAARRNSLNTRGNRKKMAYCPHIILIYNREEAHLLDS